MSESKTNVPKFASFRPKPTALASDAAKAERTSEGKHHSYRKDETREKDHRRRHSDRHRSRSRERSPDHHTEREPSRFQLKDDTAALFVVDRKGDEKNLVYGNIDKYTVPPFHRFGAGHVVGAPPSAKIDRDYGDEKGIVLTNRRDFRPGSREKYVFSKVERERPRILKIRPEVDVAQEVVQADFIELQQRGKKRKRRGSGDGNSSDSDPNESDYRSIFSRVKGKDQPFDEHLQYATESDSSSSEAGRAIKIDASVRQKNVELSRRVEESPHSVEGWIALIDHQDALLGAHDGRRRVTNAEIRSTADIKIHMYEKALDKARSLADRERLLLGLMREGEKIWEIKAQAERWEQISKDNIDSLLLWASYLNFKQTNFSTFRHEEVKEIFSKRIETLLEAVIHRRTGNPDSIYYQLIYVLVRFTLFLRESGYSELAVSIWQGLLEMNFFFPKSPLSQSEAIRLFNDFWESEVPRVGEDGALGWHHFVENEDALEAPDTLIDDADDAVNNKDLFRTWAAAERLRSRSSRTPARTMDEVVEDDPFRVILFSDIEKFLIQLPAQAKDLRILLFDGLLLFCRLPPVSAVEREDSKKWSTDSFVSGHLLECDVSWIQSEYFRVTHEDNGESNLVDSLNVPIPNTSISPEKLYGPSVWSRNQSCRDRYSGDDNGPVSYKWIRNTLTLLTKTYFTEDLAEYYLAFEFLNEPATIKKTSKNLLKQHPTCLRLYNSYALIEWSRGNKDVARGVFSTALNLRSTLSETIWDRDSIMLWRSWIWACLFDQENSTALQHLLSIADGTPNVDINVSPAVLLKAKQHLTSHRDYLIASGWSRSSVAYAQCLILLDYLAGSSNNETKSISQGDISSALDSCTSFSRILIARNLTLSDSHELLLQSAASLLLHHARVGPFRPALIREHLTRSLKLFPQNTMFLSLYTWNESRLRIDNRVRSILLSTVLTPENDTLTSRLFAIQYEIKHGTIHSVHAAFEHTLSSSASKYSPGIWRMYILYCLETTQFRSQAKDIWYRSLRACPWAKELYLIGFEKMSAMIPFSELKSTWRIMGEKELRVHVDLEERFEDIRELEKQARE